MKESGRGNAGNGFLEQFATRKLVVHFRFLPKRSEGE